jgi:hypothetical protein
MRRSRRYRFWSLLSVVLGSGCGARFSPASPADRTQSERAAPEALEQRELPVLDERPLALPWLTGKAEASAPLEFEDGKTVAAVVIPIEAETTICCFLYKKQVHPAESLRKTIDNASRGVRVRSLRMANVALVAGHPAVFLDMQYDAIDGKSQPGDFKVMFYDHPQAPTLCMHDALGFRATFERITKGFAGSLRANPRDSAAPKVLEFFPQSVDGKPAGFSTRTVKSTDQGMVVSVVESAFFVPLSDRVMEMKDSVLYEASDREGSLVRASYTEQTGRAAMIYVALERVGVREYNYEGRRDDHYFSGTFQTKSERGLSAASTFGGALGSTNATANAGERGPWEQLVRSLGASTDTWARLLARESR